MSQETTKERNVGDPVRVYASSYGKEQFYIYGRIVYIDTFSDENKENEYGILYYNREKQLSGMHVPASRIVTAPVENPPSCPSHSTTMEYNDNIVDNEIEPPLFKAG